VKFNPAMAKLSGKLKVTPAAGAIAKIAESQNKTEEEPPPPPKFYQTTWFPYAVGGFVIVGAVVAYTMLTGDGEEK